MSKFNLNNEQQAAVDKVEGAYGVIASAGAGKTRVLIERINNLINNHKIDGSDILAVSFTKNSADELEQKLAALGHYDVNVGTFHSICGRILRKEGININGYNLIKEWQADNCLKAIDKNVDVKEVLNFISFQKNYKVSYDDEFVRKGSIYTEGELRRFFKAYEEFKEEEGLYDFDDYLLMCLELVKEKSGKHTFDYILVDEHQDSNVVQNELLKEWSNSGNIFTLSDFRQAIYGFRAGLPEFAMHMDRYWDGAETLNVSINYRSAKNIVEKSNEFIKKYYQDYVHYKDSTPNKQEDGHISVHSHTSREAEARKVADQIEQLLADREKPGEIAVIYRVNKHADFIEAQLKRRGIEYYISNNSSFFKRKEIAGIIAYLRLAKDLKDENAFETVFNVRNYPLKYFSNRVMDNVRRDATQNKKTLYEAFVTMRPSQPWQTQNIMIFKKNMEKLSRLAKQGRNVVDLINEIVKVFKLEEYIKERYSNKTEIEERMDSINVLKSFVQGNNLEDFISYAYSNNEKKEKRDDVVQLMSIHRSKGLEFDNVFVVGVEDGEFPHRDADSEEEEARLMYVAVTRPRNNLYINEIGTGNRFIKEYNHTNEEVGEFSF